MNRLRAWFLAPTWAFVITLFLAPLAIILGYSLLTRGVYGGITSPLTAESYQRLVGSDIPEHSVALVLDCWCVHGALFAARLPARSVYLARRTPQELLSRTGDAALLDQFSGAHLRVDVPAARHRAHQHGASESWA